MLVIAAVSAGAMDAVLCSNTNHMSTDHISGQFPLYHDHHAKKIYNLYSWCLVPVFIPIGDYIMTHIDRTASDGHNS